MSLKLLTDAQYAHVKHKWNYDGKCPTCKGVGKIVDVRCDVCGGDGTVEKEREFEVAIPAATEDGATRRVAGQGEPGRFGGPAGDLNVIVRVKSHPFFRRSFRVFR